MMQKSSSANADELFCTRSGIPPVRHLRITAEKENSRRRRSCARYPENKKKKISHAAWVRRPCCNHIVTLLIPFCNRVLSFFCNFYTLHIFRPEILYLFLLLAIHRRFAVLARLSRHFQYSYLLHISSYFVMPDLKNWCSKWCSRKCPF